MQDKYNEIGFVQQILGLNLVPRKNGTMRGNDTSLSDFSEMWYGVFLWAAVSSLVFHLPAALLALATLRQHKTARFIPIAILLMGIVGPVCGGVLTSKCGHSGGVQGGGEDDDLSGGSGVRRGTVLLRPHHLLPADPRHALARYSRL
ncbi:transmembrane protein 170A isoform 1-T1 [Menidia menidia]